MPTRVAGHPDEITAASLSLPSLLLPHLFFFTLGMFTRVEVLPCDCSSQPEDTSALCAVQKYVACPNGC